MKMIRHSFSCVARAPLLRLCAVVAGARAMQSLPLLNPPAAISLKYKQERMGVTVCAVLL